MASRISRKEFIKQAAGWSFVAAGITQLPILSLAANANKKETVSKAVGQVIIVRNPAIQSSEGILNPPILSQMLEQGMMKFAGKKTGSDAWKSYFKPTDVVGIKVNCIAGRNLSSRPEMVNAIIAGLKSAGVNENNIIVWDRTTHELRGCGFTINQDGAGVKCYGTDGFYDEKPAQQGSVSSKLSKILSERITALINVPILKDHGACGLSLTMKNHYGSINNPGELHPNNCNPYCAELNAIPAIRNKTRLIIVDAIRPLANGGPSDRPKYRWLYNGLMISSDPVAIDYMGWQIIEEQRKVMGLPTLTEQGRAPKYIYTAAKLGLGTYDSGKMQVIYI
ncbi:MAG: DUF362 domain-containing protein [bacterium]